MTTPVPTSGDYIALPVTTNSVDLQAKAFAFLAANMPEWVPRDGHLEVWLVEAMAQMVAEAAVVAAQVPLSVFQYYGQNLLGLPALAGSAATLTSTWTLTDTVGHTIPAGTRVAFAPTNGSQPIVYTVAATVVVAPGSSSTAVGGVSLTAQLVGLAGNSAPVGALMLLDNLTFVQAVSAATPAAGGTVAETSAAYLSRLTTTLRLLAPRPITPGDFAALARSQPGVARAAAVDGYNPTDGSTGNARTVAVAVVDAAGNALSTAQQAVVAAALAAQREVNFIVNVVGPTYTQVNVTATVTTVKGASVSTVNAACVAALTAYLSKANWGGPAPQWTPTAIVRNTSLIAVLGNAPGVAFVGTAQAALGTTVPSTNADLTLPGAAPLPTVGNLNITVAGG